MEYKSNILLIDSHSKSIGRQHQSILALHELFLQSLALARRQFAVVHQVFDLLRLQQITHLFETANK